MAAGAAVAAEAPRVRRNRDGTLVLTPASIQHPKDASVDPLPERVDLGEDCSVQTVEEWERIDHGVDLC